MGQDMQTDEEVVSIQDLTNIKKLFTWNLSKAFVDGGKFMEQFFEAKYLKVGHLARAEITPTSS